MEPTDFEQRLSRFVRSQVSDVEVSGVTRLAGGWEADIYAFDVRPALPNGLDRLVVRVFSGKEGGAKAQRESVGLRLLGEAGYNVPTVVSVDPKGVALGDAFLIMERVDGVLLGDTMTDGGTMHEGPSNDFVRLFIDLHELDWRPFARALTGHGSVDPLKQARGLLESWRASLGDSSGFSAPADWLFAELDRVAPEPPAVIHRDFHPWNVLVDPTGRLMVIDWTGIAVLDRRYDLAWSLLLAGAYLGNEAREMLEQAYRAMAERPISNLSFFDVLAATMRLHQMVVSLTTSPQEVGMRAGAADAMRADTGPYRWCADLLADRTGLVIPEVEALLSDGGS